MQWSSGGVACAWQVARVGFGAMEILPQHAAASAATSRAFYPKTESKAEAGEGWRGQQHWAAGGGRHCHQRATSHGMCPISLDTSAWTLFSLGPISVWRYFLKENNSPTEHCIKVLTTDQCFIPNNHQECFKRVLSVSLTFF